MLRQTITDWQRDDDVQAHILVEDERVVGYGELWFDAEEDEVELARIIVAPTSARRGSAVCWCEGSSRRLSGRAIPTSSCACIRTTRQLCDAIEEPGSCRSTPASLRAGMRLSRSTTCGFSAMPWLRAAERRGQYRARDPRCWEGRPSGPLPDH